jgi:hypothetical protein
VPVKSLQNAQAVNSAQGEVFLNVRMLDEKSKVRNFNFADADSTVIQNASGLPQVISPPKARPLLQAIATLLVSLQLSR